MTEHSAEEKWLDAALDYVPSWIAFQLRMSGQPGCVVAIAHEGRIVLERAFGVADLSTGEELTIRHRFRVASHSKSFTAAGVLTLRQRGTLKLDDPIGDYVAHLHPALSQATIGQVLSHSAGITRDGRDCGQYDGRRPYLNAEELLADLGFDPILEANTRFKYSNHGFALLGLLIEGVTGEPFARWTQREIVDAAGLSDTTPDMPIPEGALLAKGHSNKLLLGERVVLRGDDTENAIAPASGFVSTAADLVRFFAQLSPLSETSILSVASRREMTRPHWRNAHSSGEEHYGLGIVSGRLQGWDWLGHGGGLPGYISRTAVVPEHGLAICVLTNASDGWAGPWVDGIMHICREFRRRGLPTRKVRGWAGRWWSMGGPGDHIPMGDKVVVANPQWWNPFLNATEIDVRGRDEGRVSLDNGYGNQGEAVKRIRDKGGKVAAIWFAGAKLLPEAKVAAELRERSGAASTGPAPRGRRQKQTARV